MHLTKCKRSTEQRQFIKRHPNVKYFSSSSCPVTIEVFSFFKCSTFSDCRDHNFKLNMPNKPWWVWFAVHYYFCLAPILVPPPTPYPHSNSVSLRDLPLLTFPLLLGRLILLPSLH